MIFSPPQDCEDCIRLDPTFSKFCLLLLNVLLGELQYWLITRNFESLGSIQIITQLQCLWSQLKDTHAKELPWRPWKNILKLWKCTRRLWTLILLQRYFSCFYTACRTVFLNLVINLFSWDHEVKGLCFGAFLFKGITYSSLCLHFSQGSCLRFFPPLFYIFYFKIYHHNNHRYLKHCSQECLEFVRIVLSVLSQCKWLIKYMVYLCVQNNFTVPE